MYAKAATRPHRKVTGNVQKSPMTFVTVSRTNTATVKDTLRKDVPALRVLKEERERGTEHHEHCLSAQTEVRNHRLTLRRNK
jgi:D-Tyr-tRNAtyr deacylase